MIPEKFAGFDLEIFYDVDPDQEDWAGQDVGIACAAIWYSDLKAVQLFESRDEPMSRADCREIVKALQSAINNGYTVVAVNGASFDFRILARYSGMTKECADVTLKHVDFCYSCICKYGWRLGLDRVAKGAHVKSKLKSVKLNDGTVKKDMSGAEAPSMWRAGEFDAVVEYLYQDVRATAEAAVMSLRKGMVTWRSDSGKSYSLDFTYPEQLSVQNCMKWRLPDNGWMSNPINRGDSTAWFDGVYGLEF